MCDCILYVNPLHAMGKIGELIFYLSIFVFLFLLRDKEYSKDTEKAAEGKFEVGYLEQK